MDILAEVFKDLVQGVRQAQDYFDGGDDEDDDDWNALFNDGVELMHVDWDYYFLFFASLSHLFEIDLCLSMTPFKALSFSKGLKLFAQRCLEFPCTPGIVQGYLCIGRTFNIVIVHTCTKGGSSKLLFGHCSLFAAPSLFGGCC